MLTSIQAIAEKARRLKKYRFQNLYGMLNFEALTEAWEKVNKKAAPGVDGETAAEYAQNLDENIRNTVEELKGKRYKARQIRRRYIPKGNGKLRPLGILVVKDKVVQQAAADILGAIYEQDFLECSYAYRPGRGPQQAVRDLSQTLQFGKYNYIVEADIHGFFDNMNHEWIIRMLEERVDDHAMTRLIGKWLKAGVLEEDGKVINPATGTVQGGNISPLLANIYLHYVLDLWFAKVVKPRCEGQADMCRFADDFVGAFQFKSDAKRFYNVLGKRLGKFGLELAEDKTRIIPFSPFRKEGNNCFEFLGFEFKWEVSRNGKNVVKKRTSRKKLKKSLANFTEWCKKNRNTKIGTLFQHLNRKLRGYYNYYGVVGNYASLQGFFYRARQILFKWLNRRSQRRSYHWEEFTKLCERYLLLRPRITERAYQLKLGLNF